MPRKAAPKQEPSTTPPKKRPSKRPTKRKARPAPKPNLTAEEKRILSALDSAAKQLRGEPLTQAQKRDLTWFQRRERERIADELLTAVPKGLYCELAGRQQKLIIDAAELYDLPALLEPTVNLYHAIAALHDRLVEMASQARPYLDEDGEDLKAEKLRKEIAKLEGAIERQSFELGRVKDETIDRAEIRGALIALSARLTRLGQDLGRIDKEAQTAMNEALSDLAKEIEEGSLRF